MSQPFSRFLHPFDGAHHPSLEPEVKRAILASWASDRSAVRDKPALRKPPGAKRAFPIDDILAAMRELDRGQDTNRSLAQLEGYGLTAAEIHFYRLDAPSLLQLFVWQDYDLAPDFPVLFGFLDHWRRDVGGGGQCNDRGGQHQRAGAHARHQ